MEMFFELMPPGIMQGLALSLVALGIMIPFKILNLPDLTAEASYPLGGAMCGALITAHMHPGFATIIACLCAGLLGVITAVLHLRLKINTLLAGIIVSTMVYSVNLRLMGKPNIALFELDNLFSAISDDMHLKIVTLLGMNAIILVPTLFFFYTEMGLAMRAVGANPKFAERQGASVSRYTMLGMFLANAFCGLSGSIIVQLNSYADIAMGVGIVVHGLGALMIDEVIVSTKSTAGQIFAPFVGALAYQQIYGLAIAIGLSASDLKFLTGAIVIGVLVLKNKLSSEAVIATRP